MTQTNLAKKLIELASNVPLGSCIVELGTKHGKTAILFSDVVQSGIEIFTIDDYALDRINWMGSLQDPDNEKICLTNIKEANVKIILCRMKVEDAVERWIRAIGLLYWDLGQPERFRNDFEDWSKFIVIDGVAIIKDMPGNKLDTFEVIDELVENSEWEKFDYFNGISFLRRMK